MNRIIVKWMGLLVFLIMIAVVWVESDATEAEKHVPVKFTVSCAECHQTTTPEITKKWTSGMHGLVNIGCVICHGDGEVEFYSKPSDDMCITCHSRWETDFTDLEASSCFSCHDGHNLKFHQ